VHRQRPRVRQHPPAVADHEPPPGGDHLPLQRVPRLAEAVSAGAERAGAHVEHGVEIVGGEVAHLRR
jgi:hypothetical protein